MSETAPLPAGRGRSLYRRIVGKPRDLGDPNIFHHVSLMAFLAWIGLGADGLSSSAYGPEAAFRALGPHTHFAILLVLMTAVTIFVISIAYSNLIQHFPGGGGGYLVATKLLGEKAGMFSGCALLVDYVLTITTSVAGGCDALWSSFPAGWASWKLWAELAVILLLILLNLRGVKESVAILAPIFLVFVGTHFFMIVYALGSHVTGLPAVVGAAAGDLRSSLAQLGWVPVLALLLRAYSIGGGTYTGIEAVSNGVTMLREPRVQTGKRTMFLMAGSLAFTAGGILFAYLLIGTQPVEGKTMNAVLFENLFQGWTAGGLPIGALFVIVSMVSESALLFVAAQTGFLDGPRVLANMAVDSWMPHRFAQLSDRLVTNNGIYVMGAAAVGVLLYTGGDISLLLVMYAINVFITFSLTELGMARHWIVERAREPRWKSQLAIHGTGLVMCVSILSITLYEKFGEGGWVTSLVTLAVVALCVMIRLHYRETQHALKRLDEALIGLPDPGDAEPADEPIDLNGPTAVIAVSGFSGFGLHQILSIHTMFPGHFKNFLFISVGVIDSGTFKGLAEIDHLRRKTRDDLERYVAWCRRLGFKADYRMKIGTEVTESLAEICREISSEFPHSVFFTGKLIFREENEVQNILHNETAFAIQRRLEFDGFQAIILPIRVI